MKYRPEIDGLRAIAVLFVLIFHINPGYLPGGFIGVDVFFVISGFLITSIVRKEVENNQFEYKSFYLRRIKRLLPLYYAVVLFSLIAGYFILFPSAYKLLGSDVVAANLFLANVKSSISGNYFDSDSTKPILHFWSLSVEEQFYFIMPTLYLFLHRYLKKYVIHFFTIFLLLSLGLSEVLSSTSKYAQYSYFLLPTRAWELLAGCLLAIIKVSLSNRTRVCFSYFGILLLVLSTIVTNEKSVFPGYITILPVLSAILIILGNEYGFGKILGNKILVSVGVASYSIYMWHWPIIIFLKSWFGISEFSPIYSILLGIIIIIIGFLSQKYIEDFFRFRKTISFSKGLLLYFLTPLILTGVIACAIYFTNGLPSRFNVNKKFTATNTINCPFYSAGCFITNEKNDKEYVLMIGDSHAGHFSNLFSNWFNDNKISLKLFSSGGCNFYSKEFYTNQCEQIKKQIKDEINKVKTVILVKRFDQEYKKKKFINEFSEYVNSITDLGINVILIKQVPKFKSSGFLEDWMMSRRYGTNFDYKHYDIDNSFDLANEKVMSLFVDNKNVHIIDFNNILLVNNKYLKFDDNNLPLYYNNNHLTAYGSEWIYSKIKNDKKYTWVINLAKKN